MIFVWVLRLVILFAVLTVVYVLLSRYFRWDRRKALEAEVATDQNDDEARAAYVAQGMAAYDRSLRKRLVLGVYLLPLAIVVALVVAANYT